MVLEADQENLLDHEHFSVDGTLIEAWASEKSYQPKKDPPTGQGTGSRGELLKRDTHESATDPEARLYRKGGSDRYRLSYLGHLVTENGTGLIVGATATQSSKTAERIASAEMMRNVQKMFPIPPGSQTVGADKAYHEADFVQAMRDIHIEPHMGAYSVKRADLIGSEVRKTPAYRDSMRKSKWIERCFAWIKGPGRGAKTRFRGLARVDWSFTFAAGIYNLLRLTNLRPLPSA
jgi:hypothetical protein